MLYRRFQRDEESEVLVQLVVPSKYRTQILQVGRETILSGHLGVKKTTDIIQRNFYWPGLFGDATRFCQSCDICQRTIHRGCVKKGPGKTDADNRYSVSEGCH